LVNQHRQPEPTTISEHITDWISKQGRVANEWIGIPPAFAAEGETGPPTKDEILTLQKAFAAFYGAQRDPQTALPFLDESIQNFQRQPPDEQAGLYRVRGDCKMALKNAAEAIEDYTTAIDLLRLPESKNKADPVELPASM
jgi:tetratricopeptide (TPR) repeat protein